MRVLAYDTNSNRFYRTAVEQIQVSSVSTVVNIDGLISLSGLNDQPVFVKLSNGTWVPVFSYTLVPGNFTVY